MGKLVVSLDGVVIKEVQITKDKTTLGRRPYNDIVIDNLAVSGEHAVLQMVGHRRLHRRPQQHQRHLHQRQGRQEAAARPQRHRRGRQVQDQVHGRGRHRLREDDDHEAGRDGAGAPRIRPGLAASAALGRRARGASVGPATIRVMNGAAAGREVVLTKVVTTVGKPGVQVASITKRPTGYVLAHVEGSARPTVNSTPLVGETGQPQERRRHRAGRHADAVRAGGLSAP